MMVSSKFSRHAHAFRTPDVCKKKLPEGGEEPSGNPDPNDNLEMWYDIDVVWFIWHYAFSGTVPLQWFMQNNWKTPTDPPADGEWGVFSFMPAVPQFTATIQHWVGGANVLTLVSGWLPYVDPPNFDTGEFDFASALWVGKMKGRVYNL